MEPGHQREGAGYRREKANIDEDALRIRARNRAATARESLALVVEVEAIRHYQTKKITACLNNFVEAEKR